MWVYRVSYLTVVASTLLLASCGGGQEFIAKNEPWRADDEQACLTSGQVRENLFVHARSAQPLRDVGS
jgi:hypothetical protein